MRCSPSLDWLPRESLRWMTVALQAIDAADQDVLDAALLDRRSAPRVPITLRRAHEDASWRL